MRLTRRSFIGVCILSLTNLGACKYSKRPKDEWIATDNKKIFESGNHLITTPIDYNKQSQVEVPEGYSMIESKQVIDNFGVFSKTDQILLGFINDVRVEATEYIYYDIYGEEKKREYPFAGTPKAKTLKKEVK